MIHLKKLIPDEPKRDGFFKGLKFDLFVDRIVKYVQDLHEQILECINVINSVDKTEHKDGKDGRGIEYITLNEDNSITFGLSDNTSITTDALHIESTVDLSDYYTKEDIDGKGYLTEHQSLTDYATKTWVTEQISQSGSFNPNLYYTKEDIDEKGFITSTDIPSSLPANGGDADTVGGFHVYKDVPSDAKFTDTQANWNELDTTSPAYINNKPNLASVATSGDYNDLINTPTIPTGGDTNVIEEVQVNGVALNPDANKAVNVQVPTNTNQLTNGAGFITSSQVPSNYPLETQTALTKEIAPNTFNVWNSPISNDLTITLGNPTSGVMNEYLMQFSIESGYTPQISIGPNLQWASSMNFQGGKTYQISIVNGYAIGVEFDTITQSNS